jgi:hypothetical protein
MLSQVQGLISGVMAKIQGASPSTVYIRTISDAQEDALLGIRVAPTANDVLIEPAPWVANVSYRDVQVGGGKINDGDLSILMPPNITKAQLQNALIVFNGEVWSPQKFDEFYLEGGVAWMRVIVTRKHTVGLPQ